MLVVGDVVEYVFRNDKPIIVTHVGQYYDGMEWAMLKDRTVLINEPKNGIYYEVGGIAPYRIKPRYCHLHTQPELQCKEKCNHCENFNKSIK